MKISDFFFLSENSVFDDESFMHLNKRVFIMENKKKIFSTS